MTPTSTATATRTPSPFQPPANTATNTPTKTATATRTPTKTATRPRRTRLRKPRQPPTRRPKTATATKTPTKTPTPIPTPDFTAAYRLPGSKPQSRDTRANARVRDRNLGTYWRTNNTGIKSSAWVYVDLGSSKSVGKDQLVYGRHGHGEIVHRADFDQRLHLDQPHQRDEHAGGNLVHLYARNLENGAICPLLFHAIRPRRRRRWAGSPRFWFSQGRGRTRAQATPRFRRQTPTATPATIDFSGTLTIAAAPEQR